MIAAGIAASIAHAIAGAENSATKARPIKLFAYEQIQGIEFPTDPQFQKNYY
jgi:hypothetical protein